MQQYLKHTKILLFIVSCMIPGVVTADENESCLSGVDTDLCDIDLEERECGGLSGWEIYDNDSIAGLEEGMCNIEKVSSITNERFLLEYAFEKPVIFVNVSDNSMFQKLCTKTALLARYSENNVTVSTANTHSYKKVHMTFKQYLLNGMKSQSVNKLGKDTLYFFGDNNHTEWSELFDMYQPPPYTLPETSGVYSFGVAGSGTGVPFHFHGPGFAEVIHGAKRWFLYPYDKQPRFDPNENVLNWVLKNYPQLAVEDKPVECTLKPNEVLYFPDRWWHSTLNLKASVFISTFLG